MMIWEDSYESPDVGLDQLVTFRSAEVRFDSSESVKAMKDGRRRCIAVQVDGVEKESEREWIEVKYPCEADKIQGRRTGLA